MVIAVGPDPGERQYSDGTYWETDFSVEIDPDTYQGSIHDSLPVVLKDRLDADEAFREYFEIEEPNRVWVEGESSGYWEEAEDFVITGSGGGGELIMGQVVSCDRKDYPYEKMESQVEYFLASNMFSNDPIQDTWEYAFVLGVDVEPDEVETEEDRLADAVEAGESYEVDMLARKLDLDDVDEEFRMDIDPDTW